VPDVTRHYFSLHESEPTSVLQNFILNFILTVLHLTQIFLKTLAQH
jgi:hypothetical protein